MNPCTTLRVGAITTGLGVALGAFGAHGLEDHLAARDATATWDTAVLYHLVHGLALVLCGLRGGGRPLRVAPWSFLAGIVLFSGSLYLLAATGPRWLGAVTPLGGLAMIGGWVALAFSARAGHDAER